MCSYNLIIKSSIASIVLYKQRANEISMQIQHLWAICRAQALNVLFFHYGTSSTRYSNSVDGTNTCINHSDSKGDN